MMRGENSVATLSRDQRDRAILLVEDDPDHEKLTSRALRRNNIANEIVVAHDGVEALDYLLGPATTSAQLAPRAPQMVLLDLKLPRLDGFEVLRRIRANERTRLMPVVILSSSDEEKDLVAGYSLGANSYVQKPVDFAEFLEAARQLGAYWLFLNRTVSPTD
jgi:two-component system response regulator